MNWAQKLTASTLQNTIKQAGQTKQGIDDMSCWYIFCIALRWTVHTCHCAVVRQHVCTNQLAYFVFGVHGWTHELSISTGRAPLQTKGAASTTYRTCASIQQNWSCVIRSVVQYSNVCNVTDFSGTSECNHLLAMWTRTNRPKWSLFVKSSGMSNRHYLCCQQF